MSCVIPFLERERGVHRHINTQERDDEPKGNNNGPNTSHLMCKTLFVPRATKISCNCSIYAPTWLVQMIRIYYLFHRTKSSLYMIENIINAVVLDTHYDQNHAALQ
jgi:hypothetical protein